MDRNSLGNPKNGMEYLATGGFADVGQIHPRTNREWGVIQNLRRETILSTPRMTPASVLTLSPIASLQGDGRRLHVRDWSAQVPQ